MIAPRILFLLCLCPALSAATDLNLSAESGGLHSVVATPGATVNYSIVGELSGGSSQGLAMFAFDLGFSGGPLTQAQTPVSVPMVRFAAPLGLSNPAGFGGTVTGGALVQVGGAQNTILNAFAPLPTGSVITGVAQPGSPQVLATGTLTAPLEAGTYTLHLSNVMGNVIRTGETGSPFWAVDAAGVGTHQDLVVVVSALFADVETLSVSTLGTQHLSLKAGPSRAGRIFWLLGTTAGTVPGIPLPHGKTLPLNMSAYLNLTISQPNMVPLGNSLGHLDGNGEASTTFTLPHVPAGVAGLVLHHAYVLLKPVDFASNAVEVTLVP